MAKEYEIKVLSHNSIYGEKVKENYYGREVSCYYALPEEGVNKDTGILVLIAGFGATASNNVYRKMRKKFADQYNLVTLQCDYFGYEFMQDGETLKKNIARTVLNNIFTEEELNQIYQDDLLNLNTLLQIGSRNQEPIRVTILEDLSEETIENFNDMGIMQAIDNIVCISAVMNLLEEQGKKLNRRKVILYGHSHGAYLSYLCNALAPHFISCIIDNSGWLNPSYIKGSRVLTYIKGNITCSINFSYMADKFYDSQMANLAFLYEKFENTCNIICYHGTTDALISHKVKSPFCRKIKNCLYQEVSEADGEIFLSTNHGDADYVKLFEKVMDERLIKLERIDDTTEKSVSWKTAKANYVIDYCQGLPYVTVKENKMGLEIQKLREKLFAGKMSEFHQALLECLDQLADIQREFTPEQKHFFQEAMENLSIAMQDHDYLLVTDILKFEILPTLEL